MPGPALGHDGRLPIRQYVFPKSLTSQVLIRSYILYYLLEMFVHMKLNMGVNHAIIDVYISSEYLQMS